MISIGVEYARTNILRAQIKERMERREDETEAKKDKGSKKKVHPSGSSTTVSTGEEEGAAFLEARK